MFEFEKMVHEYEHLTYDERRDLLTGLTNEMMPLLAAIDSGLEAFEVLVLASCGADGRLDVEEYSLFKDATGIDLGFDSAAELIKSMDKKSIKEAADYVVELFGIVSPELKADMCSFCLCLCSADGKVGLRESSFIRKLIK